MHAVCIAFMHARFRTPAIVLYFTKEMIIAHHPRTAGLMMVEPDKSTVTESLLEIGYVLG
jgi:hypothetical protein